MVYVPLHKVADTPFHIQAHELFEETNINVPIKNQYCGGYPDREVARLTSDRLDLYSSNPVS